MTPKEEVYAALLNNSNISKEATEYLNKILNNEPNEDSGGGALMIEFSHEEPYGTLFTMNKTAGEILTAIQEGKTVRCHFPDDEYGENRYGTIVGTRTDLEIPYIAFEVCWGQSSFDMYVAPTTDDYPTYSYD